MFSVCLWIHSCVVAKLYVCALLYSHVCLSSATLCIHLCMSAIAYSVCVYSFTPMYMWLCAILNVCTLITYGFMALHLYILYKLNKIMAAMLRHACASQY